MTLLGPARMDRCVVQYGRWLHLWNSLAQRREVICRSKRGPYKHSKSRFPTTARKVQSLHGALSLKPCLEVRQYDEKFECSFPDIFRAYHLYESTFQGVDYPCSDIMMDICDYAISVVLKLWDDARSIILWHHGVRPTQGSLKDLSW